MCPLCHRLSFPSHLCDIRPMEQDVNSGDDLMLYVEDRPYTEYVLSHHPKNVKKQVFPRLRAWEMPASLARLHDEDSVFNGKGAEASSHVAVALDRFLDTFFKATQNQAFAASADAAGASGMQPGTGNAQNVLLGADAFSALVGSGSIATSSGGVGMKRGRDAGGVNFANLAEASRSNRVGWDAQRRVDPKHPYYLPDQGNIRCSPGNAASFFDQMKEIFNVVVRRAKGETSGATTSMQLEPMVAAASHVYDKLLQILGASGQMDDSNDYRVKALSR